MIRLWRSESALVNRAAVRPVALLAAVYLALAMGAGPIRASYPRVVAGPMAWLLSASKDLGPAHQERISLAASLHHSARPDALIGWTQHHHLAAQWQPGAEWVYIEGTPGNLGSAFEVAIHDYRSRSGQVFYAAAQQPLIPAALKGEVNELGSILGYQLMHRAQPPNIPLDVPRGGLRPPALLRTYNAEPLAHDGFTGKGQTVVFFEIDGFKQPDLDHWADKLGSPRFTPVLIGGQPGKVLGETEMDLEVVHAIAPDAKLVVVNALAFGGSTSYAQAGQMYQLADRQFPGAVWKHLARHRL